MVTGLSKADLKQLIWNYDAIRSDPALLLTYCGQGYKVETMYKGITETIARLQKELAELEAKEVR